MLVVGAAALDVWRRGRRVQVCAWIKARTTRAACNSLNAPAWPRRGRRSAPVTRRPRRVNTPPPPTRAKKTSSGSAPQARERYDAIVVGLGAHGSACLYNLAKWGSKVC